MFVVKWKQGKNDWKEEAPLENFQKAEDLARKIFLKSPDDTIAQVFDQDTGEKRFGVGEIPTEVVVTKDTDDDEDTLP
jgi:hypothetical protein